ncbi:MAG: hypothetical protein R2684_13940 [Pyrinomonadaceae bacterium]
MKSARLLILFTGFLILTNCGSFQGQKTIELKSGRNGTISSEFQTTETGDRIFVVDFTSSSPMRKEAEVEKDVLDIWEVARGEAERAETEEALIKYRFKPEAPVKDEHGHEEDFVGLLFTADLMENGRWTIKRVD